MRSDLAHTVLVVALAVAVAGCASQEVARSVGAAGVDDPSYAVIAEPAYVQLNGQGEAPTDEYRRTDEARYLEILTDGVRDARLFSGTHVWSDATPADALVIDARIDADIDEERSWSGAAWLLVVPVRTHGEVQVTFALKRGDTVIERRSYTHEVVTYAVPAAEFAGRTWVEKSGVLPRLVAQFAADLESRVAREEIEFERVAARQTSETPIAASLYN